jgi:hypothetical protein
VRVDPPSFQSVSAASATSTQAVLNTEWLRNWERELYSMACMLVAGAAPDLQCP